MAVLTWLAGRSAAQVEAPGDGALLSGSALPDVTPGPRASDLQITPVQEGGGAIVKAPAAAAQRFFSGAPQRSRRLGLQECRF